MYAFFYTKNENGCHARYVTDALLWQCGDPGLSWGSGNLVSTNEVRGRYLQSLRASDTDNYNPLLAFVRR